MDQANQLFQRWRRSEANAGANHGGAIDALMQEIEMQQARERLLHSQFQMASDTHAAQAEADVASDAARERAADSARPSTLMRLFTFPGRTLAQAQQWITRPAAAVLVPAVAFGVLAVVVVPQILPEPDTAPVQVAVSGSDASVPASLLAQADATSGWLDDAPGGSAAFTSAASLRSSRFALGSISTRLQLVAAGASPGNLDRWQQTIRGPANLESDVDVQRARDDLAARLDSDDRLALRDGVAAVEAALAVATGDATGYPWYRFGQVLEAVSLSAELALAQDDFRPLEDSLDALRAMQPLPLDSDDDPLYRKVQALHQAAATTALSLRDARELRSLAQSIRLLLGQ